MRTGLATPYPRFEGQFELQDAVQAGERPSLQGTVWLGAPPAFVSLLSAMWHPDPLSRPEVTAVYEALEQCLEAASANEPSFSTRALLCGADAKDGATVGLLRDFHEGSDQANMI